MLTEFLDIDKDLIVNLHIQSVDQMKAIKLVKSKVITGLSVLISRSLESS